MPQVDMIKKTMPLIALFCLLVGSVLYGLSQPVSSNSEQTVLVDITSGMTTQEIASVLQEQGLIDNAFYFRVLAKIKGLDNSLKAGEYAFDKSMTVSQIVESLAKGQTMQQQFTIPEGFTIDQIANLLASKHLASASKFKALAAGYSPYGYMDVQVPVTFKAEGFVFPDTYKVAAGTSEEELLHLMVSQFNQKFTPALAPAGPGNGFINSGSGHLGLTRGTGSQSGK